MADAITDAMKKAGAAVLRGNTCGDHHNEHFVERVYLAMEAARQPQLPSDDGLIKALAILLARFEGFQPEWSMDDAQAAATAAEALSRHKAPLSVERTPYCPNCGESCLDKWHSSQSVAGDDVGRVIRDLAKQLYAHHVIKYDPESEERCIQAALTALQVTEGDRVERRCSICTAIVASYPEGMCCHCQEMPWPVHSKQEGEGQ